jgi:hypothetical protein
MYHFKTRTRNAPISRFSVDDNESLLIPHFGTPNSCVFFVKTPKTAAIIRRRATMPETGEDQCQEIKRTWSGGLLFRRTRSHEKQVEISRARAQEMSERYEISDIKEENLNKIASFKIPIAGTPSLSITTTAKQAAKVFAKRGREAKTTTATADPLLTERERKVKERREKIEQQKAALRRKSPSSLLSRAPLLPKQTNADWRSQKCRFSFTEPHSSQGCAHGRNKFLVQKSADDTLPESMGMEVVPFSPTSVSVAPTEAETPSPRGNYDIHQRALCLPSMC